ncbi:MAG: hypothetical protein NXI20_20175 [bacterium]|nr:hypothetical protein [bacterium]
MLIIIHQVVIIGAISSFVLSNYRTIYFENGQLNMLGLFRNLKSFELSRLKGISYEFHYEPNYRYRWKAIRLHIDQEKSITFRKSMFLNFFTLEIELLTNLKQLKKKTLTELTEAEFRDFQRENRYFDISKAKADRIVSVVIILTLTTIVTLLQGKELYLSLDFYLIGIILFLTQRIYKNQRIIKLRKQQ